jgi:hypothetical protein
LEKIKLNVVETEHNELYEYQFYTSDDLFNMFAFQCDLNIGLDKHSVEISSSVFPDFGNEHYHVLNDHELRVSYNSLFPLSIGNSHAFLTLKSEKRLELKLLNNISNEVVSDGNLLVIDQLSVNSKTSADLCFSLANYKMNNKLLTLEFESGDSLPTSVHIFDLMGNSMPLNMNTISENTLSVEIPQFSSLDAGIFILHLKSSTCSYSEKIFHNKLK